MHINQCTMKDNTQIEDLHLNVETDHFLPDLHQQLAHLSRQLSDCVDLWTSYFTLTQTTYYRWSRTHVPYRKKKLIKGDLTANQQLLIELHRTVIRLQAEYEQAMNHILDYYKMKSAQGNELSSFVPYVNSEQTEVIFVAISAMYYSTIQLAQAALTLGTTIHTIFELETTSVYRYF
jgi:hypothetical protein